MLRSAGVAACPSGRLAPNLHSKPPTFLTTSSSQSLWNSHTFKRVGALTQAACLPDLGLLTVEHWVLDNMFTKTVLSELLKNTTLCCELVGVVNLWLILGRAELANIARPVVLVECWQGVCLTRCSCVAAIAVAVKLVGC
jgi:hypothetical protein